MQRSPEPFEFEYVPTETVYGRGCVSRLEKKLGEEGADRALIVCGSNVGANRDVMVPIEDGLGGKLVGVFDETTPEKHLRTVLEGADRVHADDVDILIGVGGGSALNVTRAICSIVPLDQPHEDIVKKVRETREVPSPDSSTDTFPNIAIPTTMAGADASAGGSIFVDGKLAPESTDFAHIDANITDSRLMAEYNFYDPSLFATTPTAILASSAMNGLDKGIETLYSRTATPIAKAHSIEGLHHYSNGLTDLTKADAENSAIDHSVLGTLLVQYGRQTNLIHTFGNGISLHCDVQQGVVHGIVAPDVLRYVFDTADANRYRIADALGIDTTNLDPEAVAGSIVDEIARIRDALGLPERLRGLKGVEFDDFPMLVEEISVNYKHARNPEGVDPTAADIKAVLEAAW